MTEFTDTNLWATTLGKGVEDKTPGERDARERLRAAYLSFRDRARILAAEIPRGTCRTTPSMTSAISMLYGRWRG
jgi:hypothetical protein